MANLTPPPHTRGRTPHTTPPVATRPCWNIAPTNMCAEAAFGQGGHRLGQLRLDRQSKPDRESPMASLRCRQTPVIVLPVRRYLRSIPADEQSGLPGASVQVLG